MKRFNQLLWVLITGIAICSCTITKRHFGNGYHIEWKRRIASSVPDEEIAKPELIENSGLTVKPIEADSLIAIEPVVIETGTVEIPVEQTSAEVSNSASIIPSDDVQQNEKVAESDRKNPEEGDIPQRHLHPLMWGIWGMWGLGIAFIIVLFGGNLYAILIIAGCAFIAMIFGIIVIASLRKHPEKYQFRGLSYAFAIPSIVMGSIVVLGAILYALASFGVID